MDIFSSVTVRTLKASAAYAKENIATMATIAIAAMKGLKELSNPEEIRKKRDINEEDLWQ